ncbi:uncharacterized protein LOC143645746 [Tamandua tetradactyla]|uniref:uncharacterized protein LOC143645746 n=1 Tax=Tamandua tetradactyla TaxID=48850 RepID=UPI004053942F
MHVQLRLLSRARPVTDQQSLRSAPSSPNPRAQVDSAGPRPALSAGPTPPRRPRRSPVPAARAGGERVQNHRHPGAGIYLGESASESKGRPRPLWRETIIRAGRGGGYGSSSVSSVRGTCRAGGRPAEKTNRCFFFLLLLLPHRNTHKHPTRGLSYRGGIAASPRTNPPVGGGVPPCGLVVSEQNADRKCSCRNDSLRRRQTLTTTPSSPLHFRHRHSRRRHFGSHPSSHQSAPWVAPHCTGPAARDRRFPSLRPSQGGCGCCLYFQSCGTAFLLRHEWAGSPGLLFSWRPTGTGLKFGRDRVRGGLSSPYRPAGRGRRQLEAALVARVCH